jgi:hypothetical protein
MFACKLQFYQKIQSFLAEIFSKFLVIKTLDPELDPDPNMDQQLEKKCRIRIRIKLMPIQNP